MSDIGSRAIAAGGMLNIAVAVGSNASNMSANRQQVSQEGQEAAIDKINPVIKNNQASSSNIASTTSYWQCANGSCLPSTAVTPYATQAACTSALVAPPYTGGQCAVRYTVTFNLYQTNMVGVESAYPQANSNPQTQTYVLGAISGIKITYGNLTATNGYDSVRFDFITAYGLVFMGSSAGGGGVGISSIRGNIISVVREDALADNCGNLPSTCPI